jgi:hypothetical protein
LNTIKYIQFDPPGSPGKIILGFASAKNAEDFIASESCSLDWQAQWKIERIFAYGEFHWIAWTDKFVTLHLTGAFKNVG